MAGPYGNFEEDNTFGGFIENNTPGEPVQNDVVSFYNPRQQGVFALNPLATPKYAKNRGLRDAEFRDTLARLYIELPLTGDPATDKTVRDNYLNSLPRDAATQSLANVLLGANSNGGTGFVDFFLTQVNEPFQEIMQVDKVMSDDYVAFFYGQQPPQFQYSGTLLNSLQDDQRGGFARAYQQMLRGTQLARRGAVARLRYDSVIVTGVMTAHQQTLNADNEMAVPFSFTFLVKEYVVLTTLRFAKLTPEAYVQLVAGAAAASLSNIGTVTKQVAAVATMPPVPAATSTAGATENTSVVNPTQNKMVQTVAKGNAAAPRAAPTSNVRGTVTPNPSGPPVIP